MNETKKLLEQKTKIDIKKWTKNCPECNKEQNYKSEKNLNIAIRKNSKCVCCCQLINKSKKKSLSRKCPKCGAEKIYTSKCKLRRAIKENSVCRSCSKKGHVVSLVCREKIRNSLLGKISPKRNIKLSQEVKNKIRNTLIKNNFLYKELTVKTIDGKLIWLRNCPICKKEMQYSCGWVRNRQEKINGCCINCREIKKKNIYDNRYEYYKTIFNIK